MSVAPRRLDARALGWAKASVPGTMTRRLKAVPYTSELWRQRYPWLAKTLDDEPGVPKGNVVERTTKCRVIYVGSDPNHGLR